MKTSWLPVIAAVGALLMANQISSLPTETDHGIEQRKITVVEEKEQFQEVTEDNRDQDNSTYVLEEPESTEEYIAELRDYFEKIKKKKINKNRRDKRQSSGEIYHSEQIALQSDSKHLWLGCKYDICGAFTCPGVYYEGNDWTDCRGEVFQMYRAAGPGHVLVGDFVGLFFPRIPSWFGCPSSHCQKASCPGTPTVTHGFSTEQDWYRCGGEVFRIYARNKTEGSTISSYDDIMLYHVRTGQWVSQPPNNYAMRQGCTGATQPPSTSDYDRCWYQVFTIWKR